MCLDIDELCEIIFFYVKNLLKVITQQPKNVQIKENSCIFSSVECYMYNLKGFIFIYRVFFKLLVANNEQIRVCSLKILCAYMQQLTVK